MLYLAPKYRNILFLATSALCLLVSFAPISIWPFGFFILFPVFYVLHNLDLDNTKYKVVLFLGATEGIFISLFSYHWVLHTMTVFGNLPYILAIPIFILYALAANFRWILFFLCAFIFLKWRKHNEHQVGFIYSIVRNRYFSLSALWCICEYIGWQLFPFYGINMVSSNLFFVQIVDVIGTRGGSVVWFLLSLSIYDMIMQRRWSLYGVVLFLTCHFYGFITYEYWSNKQNGYEKKIVAVPQGNTPLGFNSQRNIYEQLLENANNMLRLSEEMLQEYQNKAKPIDLIVWPESAVPFITYQKTDYLKQGVQDLYEKYPPFDLIQNDISQDIENGVTVDRSNVFLMGEDGTVKDSYQKIKLLPFGEYLPLGEYFPAYKRFFSEVSNFEFGKHYTLLSSKVGKVMPLICYEAILPDFVWDFFHNSHYNAQLMVNITNDAWFGRTIETYEHAELVRMRSIEFRTPTVRATNSGMTTWFDIVGRNYDSSSLYTIEKKIYEIPIPPQGLKTLYSLWGSYPLYLFISLFCILLVCLSFSRCILKDKKTM